jgi:mannosylglycerate hydrolase
MTDINITIVSHTHWDRAWYVTFQEFRARLVRMVDRLIRILDENPNYRVFMLDGQMAVLEDYLEVRPQQRDKLVQLCKNGRIRVGPWYVLADEFLVSPEALIRNMQLGHRMGKEYGGVSKIGYVPDGFGHIAQLPQILRGFGIDNAFFWRGLGEEGHRLGTEFIWKAPDGSSVLTIWMPFGYHNISNLGYPVHWGDTSQMMFDSELALEQIQNAINALAPMSNTSALLLMNGIDHEEVDPRLPEIIHLANRALGSGWAGSTTKSGSPLAACTITHGILEDHLDLVRQYPTLDLPAFCGEFRWGKYSEILQGVYATRIHLKQRNHAVETLFERYTEPLAVMAWLSGEQVPEGTQDLLWTGWRWLLKNHPHDDIYGSGIDAVHDEMDYRFNQAEQIASVIMRDSLRQLCRQVDFTCQPGMPVLVYNPLGWERHEMVTGDLDFEFDDPNASRFQVVDASGTILPHQVIEDREEFWMETLKANRKRRVRVVFPLAVPACGYRAVFVQPGQEIGKPEFSEGDWSIRARGAENKYLSFEINPDGSLTINDKITATTYNKIAYFQDVEDTGDEYSFCPFPESRPITTLGETAEIRLVTNGPNRVSFQVSWRWQIPEGLADDRLQRSESMVSLEIDSRITLHRDQSGLFIETEVNNLARDHKLSVVFPIGLNPEVVSVDQPFMVFDRQIDLPDSAGWVEDPTPLMHQRAFADIYQDGRGLAIFNHGLPAVEVARQLTGTHQQTGTRQQDECTVSLILLRCVGWLSRDDLWTRRVAAGPLVPTPGAQCQGRYRFEYAIFPHPGDWRSVFPAAYAYNAPLLVARADTHEGLNLQEMNITRDDPDRVIVAPWPRGGRLPDQASFFSVNAQNLILSSLYRPWDQDGVILRYFNLDSLPVSAQLNSLLPIEDAWRTSLNEERLERLDVRNSHQIQLDVGAHEILTLLLRLAT